jgi:ATP-dependent Clp protease ATP-binding subunit ClpB
VVLFDEIEKAHPDVFNVLLQILDDGRITDSHGRTVDFKNTVIIMTSNLGSAHLLDGVTADGHLREGTRERVLGELRAAFRPEFLNRVDDIVIFKPLTRQEIERVIDLQVAELRKRLTGRELTLELTDAARTFIANAAYDPIYGARPLKRYLQHQLETRIARALVADQALPGQVVRVDAWQGGLKVVFEPAPGDAPANS